MTFDSEMVAFLALLTGLPKDLAHVSPLGVMLHARVATLGSFEVLSWWYPTLHSAKQHSHWCLGHSPPVSAGTSCYLQHGKSHLFL